MARCLLALLQGWLPMILELNQVAFKYPNQINKVLDIPTFKVRRGEKVFLYGPSGYGKTTLLEIIAGVMVPQSGEVKILNQDLVKLTSSDRDQFRANHLGYIFQSFNLIPYLSVIENICLPLSLSPQKRAKVSRVQEVEKALELCKSLNIEEIVMRKASELSVGQQQRVAAARAILGTPELILADEPTSSLDFDHREKFIHLLFRLCEQHKISVLFVSHDRSLQNLFDRSLSLLDINKVNRVEY